MIPAYNQISCVGSGGLRDEVVDIMRITRNLVSGCGAENAAYFSYNESLLSMSYEYV